jgi:small-conductance mechanosensitive channel
MSKISELFGRVFGNTSVEKYGVDVLQVLLILLVAYWTSRVVQRFLDRHLRLNEHIKEPDIRVYNNVARFIVMVVGLMLALHAMGLELSSIFTTSGLFAMALAFSMKNIVENYVSGLLVKLDRIIKPGDILEIDGMMVKVRAIGFHGTNVRTKDERDFLVPNSEFIQKRVANYTYHDTLCRVWTTVGVSYSSDMIKVRDVLEGVCATLSDMSDQHRPQILLTEFADSAVLFQVSVWIEDPWNSGQVKSNLNEAIWKGLTEAGITIAFPQLDVHLDEEITTATVFDRNSNH